MKENTYINGILSTLINNLSGKQFHYNSGIMTNPAEVQAKLTNCSSIQPNGNPFNVSQAAGIPDSCPSPIFNIDSIPSANIFLWSALKNTGSGTGIVKYRVKSPPVTVGQEFCAYTAVLANAIYDTIKKRGKLWRGFAVVNVDAALYPFVSTDSTDRTFLRKIILINNSTIDYVGGGIPGFPNHHDTAATVIYNKNNFNMTQNFSHYPSKDLFRGYLFNPPTISSSNLFQVAASTSGLYNFRGAVHNMRPDNSATDDWHPDDTKNVTTLVYDSLLMQNLHDIHLVKNIDPRAAAGSTDSLVLADPLKKIELTNYGVGY
ncbi:MAG: hypothetical protein JW795_05075, partial [Chitinivibrionales bacterium]|nr:hypothetical protein [Chitinivibrionales bacterium]